MKKNKELSEEDLKNLKKEVLDSLSLDRYALLINFPFTGNMIMHMDLIPVRDFRCRTACTDGKNIFFDIDFYMTLAKDERAFVLAHEIWHCIYMHLVRQQTRDSELFNIASDMEINYMLKQQKTVLTNSVPNVVSISPPSSVLFPPKCCEGKSAEVIYDYLLNKAKNKKSPFPLGGKSGKNNKSSSSQNSNNKNNSSNSDENSNELPEKNGNKTGKLEGQFDSHEFESSEDSSEDNSQQNSSGKDNSSKNPFSKDFKSGITDRWGDVGIDKDYRPRISKDFADKMREQIIAEAQRYERQQGHMPAGLEGIIDKITTPEIKWQEVLAQFVTSCFNGKRRWLPPARRHVYNGLYLQSRRNEKIKVTVAIDTSGSCIADLPKFFSELNNLLKSFGEYELNLLQCDAEVQAYDKYDSSNPFPIDNLSKINAYGYGGTSFCPAFKYVRDHKLEQDCFIYLTDSFGDAPKTPPPYPVLWILTKDGQENFCSWGKKLKFKHAAYEEKFAKV